ncbi:uncharacterized protein LOC133485081 isoform X2 [Phyllopteryx taeniolatus]|uniref:uncharacterized protein LOC133485081 isoform X2 n=1 Tax=Phyllopteryx taeniolatus TaxID=161469 RepID=UPI002AD51CB7|nr:uncharacterized protein LOC133485081 isoform X2 [Phyllopteryx taeniolatus]
MTARLTALLLLSTSHLIQALQPVSLVTAEVGVNVTFVCPRSENMGDIFYWYKMKVGYMIQTIVEGYFGELSLRDPTHKTFYVKQIPREKSVDAGQSVTLQCSILSESKGNVSQCPNECSVYWFKSGSGDAYPHIIYTDRDKEKAKGSCVYHLSKLIQNSSDTGIYYCAVATCGQILFGQGTNVETRQDLKPVGIVLGALLASSVIVVAVVMV